MGFGRSTPAATLGRSLDFVVGLRLEPGELLNSDCVSAEVAVGETVLPRFMVTAQLETEAGASQVRVRTQVAIDEPVVSITVTAGCESKVSRRFTLFADPPGTSLRGDAVALPPPVVTAPALPGPPAVPPAAPASEPARSVAVSPGPGASAAARPAPAPQAQPEASARPRAAAQAPRPPAPAGTERPRLKLDAPTISAVAPAAVAEREAAVRAAEAAASAAHAAASAAAARLALMEKELAALRKEAQAQRQATEHLTRVLAQTEEQGRWVPLLLVALVGLGVVVAWLAWRLKKAQDARDSAWWSQQSALPSTATPPAAEHTSAGGEELPDTAPAALSGRQEADGAPGTADTAASAAQVAAAGREPRGPAPAGAAASNGPARDVSIEELLDLEQQAEFFVVLGEDEAAIDLLVTHLRSTGGTVPLPYLKLMEIYRRRGDQASYERTRDRFNQRFSAMAPEWSADLNDGRTLEDYPVVMAHIERVWARPVDAMAILETLLFRTDTGAVFDLPAYREVLFLYTLARDLHERSAQKAAHVDVLLPLADGSGYFATTPRPHLGDRPAPRRVDVDIPVEPRPTAPVDLEVHPLDAEISSSQLGFFDVMNPAQPGAKREK